MDCGDNGYGRNCEEYARRCEWANASNGDIDGDGIATVDTGL